MCIHDFNGTRYPSSIASAWSCIVPVLYNPMIDEFWSFTSESYFGTFPCYFAIKKILVPSMISTETALEDPRKTLTHCHMNG